MSVSTSFLSKLPFLDDPRNDDVLVYVDGALVPRDQAMVSVYDSSFALGDGLWEVLRLVQGRIAFLEAHLDRLVTGAALLGFDPPPARAALAQVIARTIHANEMFDAATIRLMVTRGRARPPDPRRVIARPTIVAIPEFKVFRPRRSDGLRLATATLRYAGAESWDLRLKSSGQSCHVQALIQATEAGAHMALMLDRRGFVASCNAANFFIVRAGQLWTATPEICFNGVTRRQVIAGWRAAGGIVREVDFTPADIAAADEAFVTGSLEGITPVARIDGQPVGRGAAGRVTAEVARLYENALKDG